VHDGHGARVGAHGGDDRVEALPHPRRERLHRLGVGDHVPALLLEDPEEERVGLGRADAQLAALPVAQHHLAQLRHDDWFEAGGLRQRRRRLRRAPQRGHEQAIDLLTRQPLGHGLGLLAALGSQRRVGVPVEQVERLVRDRGRRGAMAHEHDLGRPGGRCEPALWVAIGHACGLRSGQSREERGR
jgi:hypothetical protein